LLFNSIDLVVEVSFKDFLRH